jgi:Protein of unknown function (DUF3435)
LGKILVGAHPLTPNTRERLVYALRKRVREDFEHEQAVIDISRQLSGCAVDQDAKPALAPDEDMLPQQIHLLEKLMTWPMSLSLEDELRRRSEAIDAVRAYGFTHNFGVFRVSAPPRLPVLQVGE